MREGRLAPRVQPLRKPEALNQICLGFVENLDFHGSLLRISALAVSQSAKRALPSATLRLRSSRVSLCQPGDSTDPALRARSSHRTSSTSSFSRDVILLRGKCTDIGLVYLHQTLSNERPFRAELSSAVCTQALRRRAWLGLHSTVL